MKENIISGCRKADLLHHAAQEWMGKRTSCQNTAQHLQQVPKLHTSPASKLLICSTTMHKNRKSRRRGSLPQSLRSPQSVQPGEAKNLHQQPLTRTAAGPASAMACRWW